MADLEEERRKLRMEMKFRAKYHGQHALEMGLTPEQLLLVEQVSWAFPPVALRMQEVVSVRSPLIGNLPDRNTPLHVHEAQ